MLADSPLRIVGVGNDFRCDDAAGLMVVRRLKKLGCDAELFESDGEGGAIVELISGCDRIIFVDATKCDTTPGTIVEHDLSAEPLPIISVAETGHAFALAQAIEMARTLGRLPKECRFVGIEGEKFVHGTDISTAVQNAVAKVATELMRATPSVIPAKAGTQP